MSVFMQPLGTQTLSSAANYVTFTNIPQGYTDLVVELSVRTTQSSSGWTYMATMNNSGMVYGLYSHTSMRGFASAGTTGSFNATTSGINYIFMGTLNDATSLANAFTSTRMTIKDYTSGIAKRFIIDGVTTNNSGVVWNEGIAGTAAINAPITQLQFNPFNQNFTAGSTFTLYGVSNTYDTAIPTAPTIGTVTDQAGFASVAFTRAVNDQADSYVVTSTPAGSTTYGAASPIATPAVLNTSYTYQVTSVNSLGSSVSAASSAVTTFNNYASIASYTFTDNATASFTFSNIPQNYKHLQMRFYLRGTTSATFTDVNATLNINTSNTYWNYHQLFGTGTNIYSNAGGISTQLAFATVPAATSSSALTYASGVVDFLDYTYPEKNRDFRSLHGYNNMSTSQGHALFRTGLLQNTNPITAITITCSNFAQYSRVALYGIS